MSAQPNDELREQIDDMTARLHPTGELDVDGKPTYQESRLPVSVLDKLVDLIKADRTHTLQAISHHAAIPVETLEAWVNDYKGEE